MINEHNIEAWLLDHLEGTLNASQEATLEAFLQAHPQWRPTDEQLPRVETEKVMMPDRHLLRRCIPPVGNVEQHRITEFLIAKLEGDLNAEQLAEVDAMIASDQLIAQEWQLVQWTKVTSAALHPNKERLKKGGRVVALWPRMALAASMALLVSSGAWLFFRADPAMPHISVENTVTKEATNALPADVVLASTTKLKSIHEVNDTSSERHAQEDGPYPEVPATNAPLFNNDQPSIASTTTTAIERTLTEPMNVRTINFSTPRPFPELAYVDVAQVGISAPPDEEGVDPAATHHLALTIPQFLAKTFRKEILHESDPSIEALKAEDAVAMVDRGLAPEGETTAGISLERGHGGFNLNLGRNFSVERR